MMRQSGSRNQRSKGGFRLKLVLQICLLLAICTWLLYQVKHSHDKKKAFEDKISKIATKVTSKQPYLLDFGRKGLPLAKESDSISETRNKDDENEEEEEGEQDQDMKQEEAKDEEAKRDGADTIDELDQDRGDEENEQEEEFFSEEEKDGQGEEDGLFDSKEGEDSAQEAREENYKRDDASSAVAHDSVMEIEDSKATDLENTVNGTVDDAINMNNDSLGYVAPISNVSNVSLGENMTATNADLSINGSHSTEVSSQNEVKLTNATTASLLENNVSDNNSLEIQNGSKFNDSVSNTDISQSGRSGLIPVQDENNKSDASEGHESEGHPLSSKKSENGATTRSDLLTDPVIQNEVKDSEDKAAE